MKTLLGYVLITVGAILFVDAIPIQASVGLLGIIIGYVLWESGRT